MNNLTRTLIAVSLLTASSLSAARNDIGDYSIQDAMNLEQAKSKLGNEVAFYFGDQRYGKPKKVFGVFPTNKKTNAFNKTDEAACQWAFLSAMLSLRDRALREGGDAVVEIKSNYQNNLTSSTDTFKCGAGNVIAGVALTGKVVKLK